MGESWDISRGNGVRPASRARGDNPSPGAVPSQRDGGSDSRQAFLKVRVKATGLLDSNLDLGVKDVEGDVTARRTVCAGWGRSPRASAGVMRFWRCKVGQNRRLPID